MAIDPPPLPPQPHMQLWWSKYRYCSGLVTECIAPNRQNVAKITFSVFTPHKIGRGIKTMAAPTAAVAWTYALIQGSSELNEIERRQHWD